MHVKTTKFDEAIGWYGAIVILLAYALVSYNFIVADSIFYQFLNISGGIGLLWIAYKKHVTQSVLLNIVWIMIGIIALLKILF